MNNISSASSSIPVVLTMSNVTEIPERFLRLPEVLSLCALPRSTLYDLISREAFPKQIPLGGKSVAWAHSEVTAWMKERIAQRNGGLPA